MNRGDIILITFPFSDLTSSKVRPVLVLSPQNPSERDFLVAMISSNPSRLRSETDYPLPVDDPNFSDTQLKADSVFRMSKLHSLSKILAKRKLGKASSDLMEKLDQKLRIAVGLPES